MTYQTLLRRARDNRLAALSARPQAKSLATITNIFADLDRRPARPWGDAPHQPQP